MQPADWHTFIPAASCTGMDCRIASTHGGEHLSSRYICAAGKQPPLPTCYKELHTCCRDIKSSNILLDGPGRAKVADVGLACHLNSVGLNAPEGTFVSGVHLHNDAITAS